ncbi:hypothetical protein AVEN_77744-1 [Araneus ventricosus]|uniref:Uncharacterized protein n=1 Tax=Araneus ventricosus TaxID=182803 RepID=A0A4Y2IM13_ARAVE|nr:hypothetical protein AVEN_77744-1 [Araneus ventricosus]
MWGGVPPTIGSIECPPMGTGRASMEGYWDSGIQCSSYCSGWRTNPFLEVELIKKQQMNWLKAIYRCDTNKYTTAKYPPLSLLFHDP